MKIKTIATLALGATLLTSAAIADVPELISDDKPVYVNGVELQKDYIIDTDGGILLPVRAMCETLGMKVDWVDESQKVIIEKMPVYVTFSPDVDGYTFARTAPMKLGKAPKLINDTTYVPVNFVNEILQISLDVKETCVYITSETVEAPETAELKKVLVTEKADSSLTVYDVMQGEVVLNITEETKITDKDGKEIKIADVNTNSLLEVEYSEAMTLSLPPMTNAVSIKTTGEEGYEVLNGTIIAVADENGFKSVTIGNKEKLIEQTVLNISDNLRIIAADGSEIAFSALKEGMKITATASMASTRSIPAQKAIVTLRIAE